MYFFFNGSSSLHCVFPLFFLIPNCTHCVYFHHWPLFHFEYFAYFWLPIVLRYWYFPSRNNLLRHVLPSFYIFMIIFLLRKCSIIHSISYFTGYFTSSVFLLPWFFYPAANIFLDFFHSAYYLLLVLIWFRWIFLSAGIRFFSVHLWSLILLFRPTEFIPPWSYWVLPYYLSPFNEFLPFHAL